MTVTSKEKMTPVGSEKRKQYLILWDVGIFSDLGLGKTTRVHNITYGIKVPHNAILTKAPDTVLVSFHYFKYMFQAHTIGWWHGLTLYLVN